MNQKAHYSMNKRPFIIENAFYRHYNFFLNFHRELHLLPLYCSAYSFSCSEERRILQKACR